MRTSASLEVAREIDAVVVVACIVFGYVVDSLGEEDD
jgi:hypothetical protein